MADQKEYLDKAGVVFLWQRIKKSLFKVEPSAINGNIKINGVETTVYTLPSTVIDFSSDTIVFDGGTSVEYEDDLDTIYIFDGGTSSDQ